MKFGVDYRASVGISLLALLAITSFQTKNAFATAGTSGGTVLSMGVGARAIGMGEAYTALADDVSSLYWNPAGLGLLNQSQASFLYNTSIQNISYQNASAAFSVENGGIGGSLSYLTYGQIKGFDTKGFRTSDVQAYSGVGTLGGGMLFGPMAVGASLKGVQSKLADTSASGVAGDLGGTWTFQTEHLGGTWRTAATVRNMGTGLKFINERDPFPLEWRLGLAGVKLLDHNLNVSLDYGKQRDVAGSFYAGTEYWLAHMIALRVGYAGTEQAGSGLRAGLGLRIKDVSFDYAFSGFGELGLSHLYELSFRFGPVNPVLTPEERALYKQAKAALESGSYSEAVLLFDSLLEMEPHYRPFKRYASSAVKAYAKGESTDQSSGVSLLRLTHPAQDTGDIDDDEMTALIQSGEQADKEALSRPATKPEADASTLAPFVPSIEVHP